LKGAKFFLVGKKAHRDKGDGRMLLGNNTSGGAVMLWPIRFHCAGAWTWTELPCL